MNFRIFVMGVLLCILMTVLVFGQGKLDWQYSYVADFDTISTPHGVTVDHSGNIWYASFGDSAGIQAVRPDGTHLPFSPIFELTIDGTVHNVGRGNVGINTDHEGNIIIGMGSRLFRINADDGTGMNFRQFPKSVTKPGVDENGRIYLSGVTGEVPLWILDADFDSIGVVIDEITVWTRAVEVSPDGKDVFMGSLWHSVVQHFRSEDGATYEQLDDLPGPIMGHTNGVDFDKEGRLWVCEWQDGRYNDNIYVYDMETLERETITGELPIELWDPRGVGFSETGDTAYIALFSGSVIQKWVRSADISPLLDDFEGEEYVNHWGGPWQMTGGSAGTLGFELSQPGFESDNALYITGQHTNWPGVETLLDPDFAPVDISQFKGIGFYVMGSREDTAAIRIREQKAVDQRGYEFAKYVFAYSEEWQDIQIAFEDFWPEFGSAEFNPPFDATDIVAIDWGPHRAYYDVDFYIDNIRFLTEIVSVDDYVNRDLPEGFVLYQNYPNPFNPYTTIEYYIPEPGHVTLEVYNTLGQRVSVLVDEFRQQGRHAEVWYARDQSGSELSSGVYFYRISAGSFVDIKKMTLIR